MYARVHERFSEGRVFRIVALCDKELIGRVLSQGQTTLDLKTYCSFYVGEMVEEGKAIEFMKEAHSLNLVGEKSVGAAVKAFGINAKSAKKISGIPHLQVYRI